jgi:hypothetical protein
MFSDPQDPRRDERPERQEEQEAPAGPGAEFRNPVTPPQPCDGPKGWYRRDGSLRGSEQPVPGKCGRQLRGTDPPRYCLESPLRGRDACKFHSGRARRGVEHPRFKNGDRSRYYKDLPKEWRAGYQAALADPDLTSLRGELAVQTEMVAQLLRRLSAADVPAWGRAAETLADVKAAVASKDADRFRAALAAHEQVILAGADAAASQKEVREELLEAIGQKTRTAAAEWKRMAGLKTLVTVEQALLLWRALLTAAKEIVTDPVQLQRLQERALKLLPPDN